MELKDYTEEQLRAELKRRYDERQKERESIKRCRHCEYMQKSGYSTYLCMARTYTVKNRYDKDKPRVINYSVNKSSKACEKFKQKEEKIDTKWNMTNLEQAFLESATKYFRESQSKEIDWEQRRYEIAKDALAALLSNRKIGGVYASYSKVAVDYADVLIEELKKK